MLYNMSETSEVMIAESVSQQELTTIKKNRVELHGFDDSRDIATAKSSATGNGETYSLNSIINLYHTRDQDQ